MLARAAPQAIGLPEQVPPEPIGLDGIEQVGAAGDGCQRQAANIAGETLMNGPMSPWCSSAPVRASSWTKPHWRCGASRMGWCARVLFGDVNLSGKLPYTVALREDRYAAIGIANPVGNEWNVDVPYTEGLFIGYRGFDQHGLPHGSRSGTVCRTPRSATKV